MSSDLNKSNLTTDILPKPLKAVLELEEGEIANEEPTISPSHLKTSIKESKSSSKKHQKSRSKHRHKHRCSSISSDSDSSDAEEESHKACWNKKKLHVSSSQLSSSETKEEDSSDEEYIEKPMPDFATMRYNKRNSRKKKNKKYKKKNYEASNDSPLSSSSKEDKKKKLYPCKSYIAFGKCDDIKCHCIHAPLHKEEELHRFIDENEEFFSNAFKDFPNSPLNPSLLRFLSQKFGPPKSQNSLHLNLNLNNNTDSLARPMPPPKFFSPQLQPQPQPLHSHYPIFSPSPTHIHNPYSFPLPQVFSPQNSHLSPGFPRPQVYANPSIYFEFNMQQNLTYLPQNPQIFTQQPVFYNEIPLNKPHNTLLPASKISPNNSQYQSEIVHFQFGRLPGEGAMHIETENKVFGSPQKIQSTTPNCFLASKDLAQASAVMGRRRSSMDTAAGSETHELPHEKGISPEQEAGMGGHQEKEEDVKKSKTAEKITKLVELFKAKQINKQKQEDKSQQDKKETPGKIGLVKIFDGKEKKNEAEDIFKDWEEISPNKKTEVLRSKFDNGSANDELLKKIKSALAESPTSSGSGNVKDLVNMYLKMSKNLIMENNSIH